MTEYLSEQTQTPSQPLQTSDMSRPSPTDSATAYSVGTFRKGNDGNWWQVQQASNGVQRWVKVATGPLNHNLIQPTPAPQPSVASVSNTTYGISQSSNNKSVMKTRAITKKTAQEVRNIETSLINKEEVFKMLALAESTGLPLLLVGQPGVAKTKTVLEYAKAWLNRDG